MGLSWHDARYLALWAGRDLRLGNVLTIARQDIFLGYHQGRTMLEDLRPEIGAERIEKIIRSQHCEELLLALGAEEVSSLDYSDYEGATIVHDFNKPIPKDMAGKYDCVIEAGSIEHIFDIKTSFLNLMQLVRSGGHVVVSQMANNYCGHGFYQFSPELFYRVFSEDNGFRVRFCGVHENYFYAPVRRVPDPMSVRGRIEAVGDANGLRIVVVAQKIEDRPLFASPPLQSDYSAAWAEHEEKGAAAEANVSGQGFSSAARNILRRIAARRHRIFYRNPAIAGQILGWQDRADRRRRFAIQNQPDKFRNEDLKLS